MQIITHLQAASGSKLCKKIYFKAMLHFCMVISAVNVNCPAEDKTEFKFQWLLLSVTFSTGIITTESQENSEQMVRA